MGFRTVITIALLSGIAIVDSSADGVVFVRRVDTLEGTTPSQDAQCAAIEWYDGIETLHLRSNYTGPASEFVWIIPIPSRPGVTRSSWELFEQAEQVTRPKLIVERDVPRSGCGCATTMASESVTIEPDVVKIETKEVGELHIDVLASKTTGGLVRWLTTNDYVVSSAAIDALQTYVTNGFHFVTARMSASQLRGKRKSVQISTGLPALAVTFHSDKPFYPLRISRIASAAESELLVLVVCAHRMTASGHRLAEMAREDVLNAIDWDRLLYRWRNWSIDSPFNSILRATQRRVGSGSLVVECAKSMVLERQSDVLNKAGKSGIKVWVTRFHGYLRPEEMDDIFFGTAAHDIELPGVFHIDEYDLLRERDRKRMQGHTQNQ